MGNSRLLCGPVPAVKTLAPSYVTRTKRQRLYVAYFGFALAQWVMMETSCSICAAFSIVLRSLWTDMSTVFEGKAT